MSNVLAALFGGLGAGARSYGTDLTREQDQNRLAQQRMAELQQQEKARLAQVREAAVLRQQQEDQEAEQAAEVARLIGVPLPKGTRLNAEGVRILAEDGRNKRNDATITARLDGIDRTIAGRMATTQANIDAERGLNDARIQSLLASANAGNARAMEILARGQANANQPPADTRRPMPATVGRELNEAGDVYALVQRAKTSMETDPAAKTATGWKYNLANILTPAPLESRVQSMIDGGKGDNVRATLGNLWSTIGKMRSGGAITDAEFKRLEPFLPSASDDFTKAQTKLAGLEREYSDIIQRKLDVYGGTYRVPDMNTITGRRAPAPQGTAPTRPTGSGYSPRNPFAGGR